MSKRLAGPLITVLMVGGIALILLMNLETGPSGPADRGATTPGEVAPVASEGAGPTAPVGFREYPIGDEQARNHMTIAAVWLPGVGMDGMASSDGLLHLEADIKATRNNPHGFANEEFVPYLKVRYRIRPSGGGEAIAQGEMIPMVAGDGLHYGASIEAPPPGEYTLTYEIQPPSAGGLGRHSDPATGVAPWWEPFEVQFDWEFEGAEGVGVALRP